MGLHPYFTEAGFLFEDGELIGPVDSICRLMHLDGEWELRHPNGRHERLAGARRIELRRLTPAGGDAFNRISGALGERERAFARLILSTPLDPTPDDTTLIAVCQTLHRFTSCTYTVGTPYDRTGLEYVVRGSPGMEAAAAPLIARIDLSLNKFLLKEARERGEEGLERVYDQESARRCVPRQHWWAYPAQAIRDGRLKPRLKK